MPSPDLPFRLPSLGSLTGFVTDLQDGPIDLAQTGWSVEQIRKFLSNEGDQNFITREWAMLVNRIIQDHLSDRNNPHEVTLDQVTPSVVADVLGRMIPGTPPVSEPTYALDPGAELLIPDMVPAAHNLNNCLRMTGSRNFVAATDHVNTDYLSGRAGWALYSELTDKLLDAWLTNQDTEVNGVITQTPHPAVAWTFPFWSVAERHTIGLFGVSFPSVTEVGKTYTAQWLVRGIVGGRLTVYNKSDAAHAVVYDLDTHSVTGNNASARLTATAQIEDWVLLSFTFKATETQSTIFVTHADSDQVTPTREGKDNRLLFLIAKPTVARCTGLFPFAASESLAWSSTPIVPDLSTIGVPANLTEFTINLHFYLQPGIVGEQVDTLLFRLGALQLTRTSTEWQLRLGNIVIQSRPILEGLNIFTISYSPTTMIIKSIADDRRVYPANYPYLETSNIQIGPCGGYLLGFYLYPHADKSRTVEFLTNA